MYKNTTLRFNKRKSELKRYFNKNILTKLWKNKVKNQIRNMPIIDLHDFYDFHKNLNYNIIKIENNILSGQYRVQSPIIYKLEKKIGICRHMINISPSDTLVLQVLIQSFCTKLEKAAPSTQAYYSRDKSPAIKLPHELTSYNDWFTNWTIYQNNILKFTETKKYIIITDISNYYDSIRLKELRNIISQYVKCKEVFLDLIFNIIEDLSWKPDYLPSYSIGLPTINLEAIRLLAHSFLFEIDKLLKDAVQSNFVRWMDDIVIGTDSIEESKSLLNNISEVLKSRGLYLNMSKTLILDSNNAKQHFLFDENIQINKFEEENISENDFIYFFKEHWENNKNYKHFDQVLKRLLKLAGDNKFTKILKYLPDIFKDYASLRTNVCQYLYKLGYNQKTFEIFKLLLAIDRYDDITLFLLISLTTDWNIGRSKDDIKNIKSISGYLKSLQINKDFNFYNYLLFAAKYEDPNTLYKYIDKYKNFWIKNPFLTRQISSIICRLLPSLKSEYENLYNYILQRDYQDASSVIFNMEKIKSGEDIKYLKEYLFPITKHKKGYPLSKFLILYNFCLNNSNLNYINNSIIKNSIKEHIQDEYYLFWLNHILK